MACSGADAELFPAQRVVVFAVVAGVGQNPIPSHRPRRRGPFNNVVRGDGVSYDDVAGGGVCVVAARVNDPVPGRGKRSTDGRLRPYNEPPLPLGERVVDTRVEPRGAALRLGVRGASAAIGRLASRSDGMKVARPFKAGTTSVIDGQVPEGRPKDCGDGSVVPPGLRKTPAGPASPAVNGRATLAASLRDAGPCAIDRHTLCRPSPDR